MLQLSLIRFVTMIFITTAFLLSWQFAHVLLFVTVCAHAGVLALGRARAALIAKIAISMAISLAFAVFAQYGSAPVNLFNLIFVLSQYRSYFFVHKDVSLSINVCTGLC